MKSNLEWKEWGERDPLYAVATWSGKERGKSEAWTDEDFYELGRSDWADFKKHWTQYGVNPGACVEIGCGAGRMSKQLGQFFEHLTALDVSQHQLDYARKNIPAENVTFTLSDGLKLPLADASCDAAFSVHVFQHFETHKDAYEVFRELHRVLKPGGSFMVHLMFYNFPGARFSKLLPPVVSFAKRVVDIQAALARRQMRKGNWKPLMRILRFDRPRAIAELRRIGFTNIELREFAVTSNHDYHEFVFATKGA